ncbi:GntR family transcriptional regulator [Roseomonas sp. OT10]|uniref:GntR family transcriptional regulator n=1 Tax=Roseomonas cutis TaxID=2897332 RepID=UPI001E45F639|nr:GntR family transcriptional regulator [Roseomonas sp. OT10]UFN48392.1 GntR family transcriptional regulator [Roseomonas sp. OT10]
MASADNTTKSRDGQGVDRIRQALRAAILERALPPATRLPEATLAEAFGVSRTVIRGALAQLAGEGLVEVRANRSNTVAMPGEAEAEEVFATRASLEVLLLGRIGHSLTVDQIGLLRENVVLHRAAIGKPEAIRLGGEFHLLLASFNPPGVLRRYVEELVFRSSLVLASRGPARAEDAHSSVNEHQRIVDALDAGDVAEAANVMDRHLRSIGSRVSEPRSDRSTTDLSERLMRYRPAY